MQAILARFRLNAPRTRLILKFLFVVLLLLGIVAALLPSSGGGFPYADKIMHTGALFGFAVLLDLATPRSFWRWKVPVLLGYGALIEVVQSLTTWRSASLADLAADAGGILLYWVVWRLALQRLVPHNNG
ncbi:MAG: VanZ family protein [Thiothrix lacustris]|uniref:VanZ family protein n=1 Tax=Thiothrix lacustris TaxID=525917 RepID=A0A1Y1Q7N9_9GAMM|nr:MAG: VanZ family protein [Thiothrix lacustris]